MSAFGFAQPKYLPSPDPRAVGQALAQQRLRPPPVAAGPVAPAATAAAQPSVGDPLEHSLRQQGAHYLGGAGQLGTGSAPANQPEFPHGPMEDARTSSALGEALSRLGGGVMPNPTRTPLAALTRRQQLLRLGLSDFEITLLQKSGGA